MDDLNFVAVTQNFSRPLGAAHDALIEFNRNLLRFQIQTRNEFRKCKVLRDFASFAIDLNLQEFCGTSRGRMNHAAQFNRLVFDDGANQHRRAARSKVRHRRVDDSHAIALRLDGIDLRPERRAKNFD